MKKIIFGFLIFFTFSISNCYSNSSDIALKDYFYKLKTDTNNIDNYLDSLIIAYPNDFRFSYQKAIALIQKDMIKPAYGILDSLVLNGVKDEMLYQLLINCYIQDNNLMKAVQVADSAIAEFPNSPRILLETAYLQLQLSRNSHAIYLLETALYIDPYYFESYYPLIDYYPKQGMYVNWAVLYSEIFINLSTNENRSVEISKKMFDIILNALPQDTTRNCNFTNITYYYRPGQIDSTNYNFSIVYNIMMTHAYNYLTTKGDTMTRSIKYICSLLTEFNRSWYNSIYAHKWNNPVLAYHKLLIENNLFEPYCFLILKEGNVAEFNSYIAKNSQTFLKLLNFMERNKIDLKAPYLPTKNHY